MSKITSPPPLEKKSVDTRDKSGCNLMLKKTKGTIGTKVALRLEDKAYLMRLGPETYVDLKHHPTAVARCVQ